MPLGSSFKSGRPWLRAKLAWTGLVLKGNLSKHGSQLPRNSNVSSTPIAAERPSGATENSLSTNTATRNIPHIPENDQTSPIPDPEGSKSPTDTAPLSSQNIEAGKEVEDLTSPIWDQAMKDFQDQKPSMFALLKDQIEPIRDLNVEQWDTWSNVPPQGKPDNPYHAWVSRCKARLPSLTSIKSLAVRLSNLDPHGLAPYIVTGAFVAIELCLGVIDPTLRETAMALILNTSIIINKWNQCEDDLTQMKRMRMKRMTDTEIVHKIEMIERKLPTLYEQGLDLISSVYESGKGKGEQAMAMATSIPTKWTEQSNQLESSNKSCTELRSQIDEMLKKRKGNVTVLNWIKDSGDPEPTHEAMSYKKGLRDAQTEGDSKPKLGQWFFEGPKFTNWVEAINRRDAAKRVCWLKGTMGTGKTSLMCRIVSHFREVPIAGARVIHYYCEDSNTGKQTATAPEYETIIRALCCRLAWNENGRLAEPATTLYSEFNPKVSKPDQQPTKDEWEKLLRDLISVQSGPTVLVIDALDECRSRDHCKELLGFLAGIQTLSPGPYFLLSSRKHIPVADYFNVHQGEVVDAVSSNAENDMKVFITSQISSQEHDGEMKKSIFFSDDALRRRLEMALFRTACGMYRWVEVWLGVFFPKNAKPIRLPEEAEKRLKSLEEFQSLDHLKDDEEEKAMKPAYENLWKINNSEQYRDYQIRAFRFLLASLEPLTSQQLLEAVRFDPDRPDHYAAYFDLDQLEGLYHNFLTPNGTGHLQFEHVSAKVFVSELKSSPCDEATFSRRLNLRFMADVAIKLLERPAHMIWKLGDIDLINWSRPLRQPKIFETKGTTWMRIENILTDTHYFRILTLSAHFSYYLLRHWVDHCQSIFLDNDFHHRIIGLSRMESSGLDGYILFACCRSLLKGYGLMWAEESKLFREWKDSGYHWSCSLQDSNFNSEFFRESEHSWARKALTRSPRDDNICSHPFLYMVSFGISPLPASGHSAEPRDPSRLRAGFQVEDLTVRNLDEQTALHIASSMGRENIVQDLLKLEPKLLNSVDCRRRTPLCLATTEPVVESLLATEALHSGLQFPPDVGSCESEVLNWEINESTPAITWLIQRLDDNFILWLLQRYKINCLATRKQQLISVDDWMWKKLMLEGDVGTISLISTALRAHKPKTFYFLTKALGDVEYEAVTGNVKFKITSNHDVDTMLRIITADQRRRETKIGMRQSRERLPNKAAVWPSFGVSEEFSRCKRYFGLTDCLEERSESLYRYR